ncbi:DUF2829 domain-containing protein [Paenibacillus sp. GYB004]|uniref:DUF2829 domain-containing protein n=1 Tax=Paenibacillus sp. GYB004 TaxID=2994393 RepID=UPI002F96E31B
MNFGQAIEAVKAGKSAARKGWNGKGMFIYLVKGNDLSSGLKYGFGEYEGEPTFTSAIFIKTAQNTISPWQPSNGDMLAEDWVVVE